MSDQIIDEIVDEINPDPFPAAYPGANYSSYCVGLNPAQGLDYYHIVALDGTQTTVTVPTGTPYWRALGLVGPGGIPLLPAAPRTVTNFQLRAALMAMPGPSGGTMYDAVDAAVHAQGGVALQAWEYANEVNRTGPLVQQMAAGFGFSEAQLDALFTAAAGISA
jgi:hypothetical protein